MAIANETYWEVRGGAGSDTNGGGFAGNGDLPTLAAPTVTGSSTGGTIGAGTYYTVVSYAFYEVFHTLRGPKSATTATTVTGSTNTLTVTSPVAHPAANFYNVYMSTSANGPFYIQSSNVAIGTDYVRTTYPASVGQQPLGVDYSQQNAAQVNIDNSTITTSVTTTVITFTAGYTPTAADVGNQLYIASGTNITAGFWLITGWTATTWTVDRNIPSAGTTVNMIAKMGGALNTISAANAAVPASSANIINIKSGTYAETITTLVGGGNKNPFTFRGYGSARGDNPTGTSRPLIDGGSVRANCAVLGNSNVLFENLRFANSTSHAIASTTGPQYFHNCKFSSAGGDGISSTSGPIYSKCESSANVGNGFTAGNYNYPSYVACYAHDNGAIGFSGGTQIAFMSVSDSNVSHGFRGATGCYWVNCTAYGSASGSGIFPGVASSSVCQIANCVATGNNQFGFTDTTSSSYAILRNCYSYGNATGPYENVSSPPVTDVDPQIVDAPNADFRVGANMKALGIALGSVDGLAADCTSYVDIGAVQRREPPAVVASLSTLLGGSREESFTPGATLALGGLGVKASETISSGATLLVEVRSQSDDSVLATLMSGAVSLTTSYQSWSALASAIGGGAVATWTATPAGSYYVRATITYAALAVSPTTYDEQFVVLSTDTTAPSPSPEGYVSSHAATSFVVTVTAVSGEASTTIILQTRSLGSNDAWTIAATDATPAVGDTLTASGLTQDAPLEWRIVEEDAVGNQADGTHGIVTPAESLWATLTATVSTALQGQGLANDAIYFGFQPETNQPTVCAVLRTRPERVRARANNVEQVELPVEVEIRALVTTDDGSHLKTLGDLWQRRLEVALHEKHAADFPGIPGLEEVAVEIAEKDDHGGVDVYTDEIRTRATVRFLVWRAK